MGEPVGFQVHYNPTPKQRMFHSSVASEVLFGGAAGGGKTKAIAMDAVLRCLKYPGTTAGIFRRTFRELESTVIPEVMSVLPKRIAAYNSSSHRLKLINGSEILFCHCQNISDRYTYLGEEFQWLYFDELTTFEKDIYDFLRSRLRTPTVLEEAGVYACIRCSSNPGGIGHGWVKEKFVTSAPFMQLSHEAVFSETLQKTHVVSRQYIPSLAIENPHISEGYIIELEQKPEALRKALLEGSWDAFEGQVFMEWRNDPEHYMDGLYTHVIEPFKIPHNWPRYRSMDWGHSRPFSIGWWAVDPQGRYYRYREWYGCEKKIRNGKEESNPNTGILMPPKLVARRIKELEDQERKEGIPISGVADPSIYDASRGKSIAFQMSEEGVHFLEGDNKRIPGKMLMHDKLRFDKEGRPGLYVFNTCVDFIRTIPSLPYSDTKVEDVSTESEDHIYDETRYFLMCWPTSGYQDRIQQRTEYDPLGRVIK